MQDDGPKSDIDQKRDDFVKALEDARKNNLSDDKQNLRGAKLFAVYLENVENQTIPKEQAQEAFIKMMREARSNNSSDDERDSGIDITQSYFENSEDQAREAFIKMMREGGSPSNDLGYEQ